MPDERTLCAVLDAVDVGMALVGPDRRVQWANAAYADFVDMTPADLEGTSLFGRACPCDAFAGREEEWERSRTLAVTGESPDGTVVEVVARPVTPDSDVRLVVVRRGFVRPVSGRRLPPDVVAEMSGFLTDLTGHAPDPAAIGVAPIAMLVFAVDDLAGLRGRLGAEGAEEALRQVARALVLQKRKADIVSRYGDGQFLVIAPDTTREGAAMLVERIEARLAGLVLEVDGEPVQVALRTWAAEYRPALDGSLREAVRRAAEATRVGPS